MDAEKAFDKVLFTTVNKIFEHFDWPSRFRSLIKAVYSVDTVSARTVTNGCVPHLRSTLTLAPDKGVHCLL